MLSKEIISAVLGEALKGGDFAEIFVEHKKTNNYTLSDGKVDMALSGVDFGLGLRIMKGYESIYVYTNDLSRKNLVDMARETAGIFGGGQTVPNLSFERLQYQSMHTFKKMPDQVKAALKIDLMKRLNHMMRAASKHIHQVIVGYGDSIQDVLIANSEGLMAEDRRVRTRVFMQSVAEKDGKRQTCFDGPGAHRGFEFYEDEKMLEAMALENARTAVNMLKADDCPGGVFPVVIENGFGGVIFHEACGHSLEATSVAKGHSVFSDRLGEQIADACVTAIDDGTIPYEWGSSHIDDEGQPTQKNVLIEKGILKNYLIDRLGARRMKMPTNGCGRRESYRYAPTSRMSNTYIQAGQHTKEEMLSDISFGIYAKKMGGGSVDPATGSFNFAVTEAYLIEDGKITAPVRGATLIGKGEEVLKRIDRVGTDMALAQGMCGSVSGSIPVNVGQPAIRVSKMIVGGRKGK